MLNITELAGFGFVESSFVVGAATGTDSVTMPAHQAGDLIVAFAFRDGSTTLPTLPAGWTSRLAPTGANSCSMRLATKIAASSSETSGTWTNATSLIVLVLRGVTYDSAYSDGYVDTDFNFGPEWIGAGAAPFKMLFFAGLRSTNTGAASKTTVTGSGGYSSPVQLLAETTDATDAAVAYLATVQKSSAAYDYFQLTPSSAGTSSGIWAVTMSVR